MDVPEIRAMVALHLCRLTYYEDALKDLTVCVRVCKDWHATFKPLLYYFLNLKIYYIPRIKELSMIPPPEVLQANRHLFQELYLILFSIRSPILQLTVATLRHLKKLRLRAMYKHGEAHEIDWLSLRPLLVNNRGIQELSLANITHPDCFPHIAEDCTAHLTTLNLSNMKFEWPRLLLVLTSCRRLSKLECYSCTFNRSKEWLKELDATSRQTTCSVIHLQLHMSSGDARVSLADWVEVCPRLETLSITKDRTIRLGSDSQFSPGPELSSVTLDCRLFRDAELAEVLTRCTSLSQLTLERASITREAFGALSGHFGSLVCLNLLSLPMTDQWMIKRILEGCPRLVELCLFEVDVSGLYSDALDDREELPWACRDSLMQLSITTMRMSFDGSVNDRFMKQLMGLKRLQDFTTRAICRGNGSNHVLDPKDVPRDTPEGHFLATMCERKDWGDLVKDLGHDPIGRLLRSTWPKLVHFGYNMDVDGHLNEPE